MLGLAVHVPGPDPVVVRVLSCKVHGRILGTAML